MDDGVSGCHGWDGEVVVAEVNCVRDAESFGLCVDDTVAAIVFEGDANVETVLAAEVPGAASGGFVVDDNGASEW